MKKQIPLTAVLAVVVVIVAAAGYLALMKPKKEEATQLRSDVEQAEADLLSAQTAARASEGAGVGADGEERKIRVAELVKLAKAMPDEVDMAGTLVQLGSVASSSGVEFVSIQPLAPVPATTYRRVPIQLTFDGSFYDLVEVLYDLRGLVRVREGELQADGPLVSLDQFELHESSEGFPRIEALMTVSTYLNGLGADAAAATPLLPVAPAAPAPAEPAATSGSEEPAPPAEETIQSDPDQAPELSE